LERLGDYRKRFRVAVHAYCLMPNHVHILVETNFPPLSRFMQGLQQSYTQYFNRTHRKIGHVFQGRYKAIVCDKDEYLLALVRYIHQNPVRAKMVRRAEDYPYSGQRSYLAGQVNEVVDPRLVLEMLGGKRAYRRFMDEAAGEGHREDYYQVQDQRFLGSTEFEERVKEAVEEEEPHQPKKPLRLILRKVAQAAGMEPEILAGTDRTWAVSKSRALAGYVLTRRMGYGLGEVSSCLGRDIATMSSLLSRFSARVAEDPKLRKEIEQIVKIV